MGDSALGFDFSTDFLGVIDLFFGASSFFLGVSDLFFGSEILDSCFFGVSGNFFASFFGVSIFFLSSEATAYFLSAAAFGFISCFTLFDSGSLISAGGASGSLFLDNLGSATAGLVSFFGFCLFSSLCLASCYLVAAFSSLFLGVGSFLDCLTGDSFF